LKEVIQVIANLMSAVLYASAMTMGMIVLPLGGVKVFVLIAQARIDREEAERDAAYAVKLAWLRS